MQLLTSAYSLRSFARSGALAGARQATLALRFEGNRDRQPMEPAHTAVRLIRTAERYRRRSEGSISAKVRLGSLSASNTLTDIPCLLPEHALNTAWSMSQSMGWMSHPSTALLTSRHVMSRPPSLR